MIDHVEEHTIGMVLDAGHWGGMTLYPESKCSPARAIDMIERFGSDRLWWDAACDWGPSVPLAVPRTACEMRRRGHDESLIEKVIFENPKAFLSQSDRFQL